MIQGAGFEITNLLDESTAANAVLRIKNGAIVDIGGGTTGISIFKDGEVVYVADEPTGGTHFSLVLAGALRIPFEEAERKKRDPAHHKEILPVLKPVVEKVAAIVKQHIQGYNVDEIYLVGGTCCLTGIEGIIQKQTGIPTLQTEEPHVCDTSGYCPELQAGSNGLRKEPQPWIFTLSNPHPGVRLIS